jgi:SAM-dependent methyltransferase
MTSIKDKQLQAYKKTEEFLSNQNKNNPNLTGPIWDLINDNNEQRIISENESKQYSENWSQELVGKLQRTLVNYQLYQLKIGNPPPVFFMIKEILTVLLQLIPNEKDISLLDIGCTSGYYNEIINFFYPNTFKYSGCDYNKASVELAKEYYPTTEFKVEDITKLNYRDQEWKITFMSGVIEHVPDYKHGLSELCRVTGKYIVLHRIWLTPNQTSCKKGTQYFVPVIRNMYNENEFISILKNNKFKQIYKSSTYDGNCNSYIFSRY